MLGSSLVVVGSLVTAVLPTSSAVAHAPALEALRSSQAGRMGGLVVVMVGLGLLGAAWLRLLASAARPPAADPGQPLRAVYAATAAWSLPLLVAPPLFSRDAWSYAAQGALTHLGLSPYVWTPRIFEGQIVEAVDPIWMNTPSPYGPLPLAWGAWLAGLVDDAWLLAIGHRALALLGLALLAWAVPRLAARAGQDPARAAALVLASPLTIAHGVGGAHNDLAMAGLMAAALAASFEKRWLLAAALGGAAAAVKLPGGAVCIGVVLVSLPAAAMLRHRLRRLTSTGLVAVGVLVGSGLLVGVGVGWVHALGTPGLVRTPLSMTTQLGAVVETAARVVGTDVVAAHAVEAWRGLGLAAAVGTALWVALRGRTGDRGAAVRAVALVTTALAVLGPAVHPWYLLWCLPFLAACRWGPTADAALRDVLLVLGIIAPLDSSLRGEPSEILAVVGLGVVTALRLRFATPGAVRRDAPSAAPGRWWRRARPASPSPSETTGTARPVAGRRSG